MLRHLPSILICLVAAGCGGGGEGNPGFDRPNSPATYTLAPEHAGDGWAVSTPAAEGMDADSLMATFNSIRDGHFPGVDSMVVIRNQRLVAEGYFNGFDRETVHELRSTGKSFVSTLVGIALDQGLFGIDDPLSQHIAGFAPAITLRHLLNMSSGLDCNDWDERSPGHEEKMYDSRDWIAFMMKLRMIAEPGAVPYYCTGGVVLLGQVVSLRSGMKLDDYADQWLLGPLSIQKSVWRHSPDGKATGGTGFGLTPRDAAKLGALFANEGVWNGTRLISEAWVTTTRQRAVTLGSAGYGYLWWKRTFDYRDSQVESVFTAGNGGNFIFVVPSHELVVAFTGSNYNTSRSDTPQRIMPLVVNALR